MLSDFDLSKQSDPNGFGGAPAAIKLITPNGVPLVDTKSCIADFRTNSFVGTEGESRRLFRLSGVFVCGRGRGADRTPTCRRAQSTSAPRSSTGEDTARPSTGASRSPSRSIRLVAHHVRSRTRRWTFGILVYEMLYGCTPFKGPNRHATFSNVLRNEPSFPDHPATTTLCKSVIKKLLIKDENRRLGSQSGASEVKQHRWFASINWGLLRHQKPPIIPQVVCVALSPSPAGEKSS